MSLSHGIAEDKEKLLDGTITPDEWVLGDGVSQSRLAFEDARDGLKAWRVWSMLAYQDIQLRYRRSVLGPLWITLSMAITVYSMGILYAHLFNQDLSSYFPFLTSGILCWTLISSIITDATDGLIVSDGLVKQIKLPYSLYIHRIACRNFIMFFHNILVIIPIFIIYHETVKINFSTTFLIIGMLVIYINSISYGLIFSMIGARYRDISQLIKSMLQIIFFITPIMWNPHVLGPKGQLIIALNPVYAMLEMIRAPLIGQLPTTNNLIMSSVVTLVGVLICASLFCRYRSRIVYWL